MEGIMDGGMENDWLQANMPNMSWHNITVTMTVTTVPTLPVTLPPKLQIDRDIEI